jgi:hypothetical protein
MEQNMLRSNEHGQSQIKRQNPSKQGQSIPLNQILSSEKRLLDDDQMDSSALGSSRSNPQKNRNSIDIHLILENEQRNIPTDDFFSTDSPIKKNNTQSSEFERVRSLQHKIKDMLPDGDFEVDDLNDICHRFGFYQYHLVNHLIELGLITRVGVNLFRTRDF